MKRNRYKIYLSHPIWEQERGKFIQKFLEERKIEILNPFDFPSRVIDVINKDLKLITEADMLLAYLPVPNIGVSMEIMYAWMIHKPIYIITGLIHPWLKAMKAIKCKDLEDFWKKSQKRRNKFEY